MTYRKIGYLPISIISILVLFVAYVWYYHFGPGYYSGFERIKEEFANIPGVEIIKAGGNKDLTFQDISIDVVVKDKGPIGFRQLSRSSFSNPDHVFINTIGPYIISIRGEGYFGVVKQDTGEAVRSRFVNFFGIDLKDKERFGSIVPFSVKNVTDVIDKYDEIVEYLSGWPQYPNYRDFTDPDGTFYQYSVKVSNKPAQSTADAAPGF